MVLITKKRIFILVLSLQILSSLAVWKHSKPLAINGVLYAVNKGDKSITVINLKTNKNITEIPLYFEPHEITSLKHGAFHRVIVSNYGSKREMGRSLTVINPFTNKICNSIDLKKNVKPHGIVSIPNTHLVALSGELGNAVMLVDIKKGKIVSEIKTKHVFSHLLAVHPNKKLIYLSNANANSISVLDWEKCLMIDSIPCEIGTQGLAVSPDGNELWSLNSEKSEVSVYALNHQNKLKIKLTTGKKPMRISFTSKGNFVLITNAQKGVLSVYKPKSYRLIKEVEFPGNGNFLDKLFHHTPRPAGVFSDKTGKYAFVSNSNASKIELVDLSNLQHIYSYPVGKIPDGILYVPNE